jgi:membrane-associated phospholipid phosphatase
VNAIIDTGVTVGSMILLGAPRLFANETVRPWCGLECDPNDVNPLDRTVIGNNYRWALRVSDAGFISSMALPFTFGALDLLTSNPSDGFAGYATDVLVLAETLSITLTANNLLSFVVRRPRPHTYNTRLSDEERLEPNNAFSFPSGHTSASFAMATAYSRLYMLRHPNSPGVVPMWLGTYAVASVTGVFRPLAGDHFWSDVMIGCVTGIATGLLIPWLHMPDKSNSPTKAASWDPRKWSLRVLPLPIDHGAGLFVVAN